MVSEPAKSAIVRASLSTRWNARALNCNCCIAARISDCPVASSLQNTRTSAGVMSALHSTRPLPLNRCRCRSRAVSTRAATAHDGSPICSAVSFSYGTRGTST